MTHKVQDEIILPYETSVSDLIAQVQTLGIPLDQAKVGSSHGYEDCIDTVLRFERDETPKEAERRSYLETPRLNQRRLEYEALKKEFEP